MAWRPALYALVVGALSGAAFAAVFGLTPKSSESIPPPPRPH